MKVGIKFLMSLGFAASSLANAQTHDSNAEAKTGFVEQVKASKGVIIRVPTNDSGLENMGAAEMRMHVDGKAVKSAEDLADVWQQSKVIPSDTVVNSEERVDSSTCGWWGYRYARPYWVAPRAYYYYTPTYYYMGSVYRYDYVYSYPAYGYRYYYYW